MKTRDVTLRFCASGLHTHASAVVAKAAKGFTSSIRIAKFGSQRPPANAKSLLEILMIGAMAGDRLCVEADGPDEAAAIKAMAALLSRERCRHPKPESVDRETPVHRSVPSDWRPQLFLRKAGQPTAAPEPGSPRPAGREAVRVAVVNDHQLFMCAVSVLLEREGFTVVCGSNGFEAVELRFADPPPVVMIINGKMPGMRGDEAIAEIRRREVELGLAPVLIIFESALTLADWESEEDTVEVFSTLIDGYLPPYFAIDEIGRLVRAALRVNDL